MANGIGSVWAANYGEDGKPNGVGSVWIENIDALAPSGGAGDEEVNQAVHTNSATWNNVSDKLDTTAFSDVSSTFLTAHQSLEGYATTSQVNDLSGAIDYVSANVGVNIPVSNSGNLYKVEFDGVDLYGYKSTTDIPNYAYSAVSSQQNTYIQYTNYPQWNNPGIQDLRNWSAFDVISISSNGERIYSSYYGDNRLTALDVYYAAQYVYDYNDNQLADFSGYIGKITLDNLVISSYFDKPSYYNDIARVSEFKLWFSANNSPGGNIESNYICSVGNEVQSGTNTINGIIVPSEPDLSNYIPYTTTGLELPNSHFKVDTGGRAYKLEVVTSAEKTLTTADFSANNTLRYNFVRDNHYVVQVPLTRVSFEVHGNTILDNIDPEIICSGVVQDGVCDFVYPSTGATGRKWFITKNIYTTASLSTANCTLYSITTSPSGEYVLASELDYISASYDNLYSAFTAYTASHP